jgi:hypothetical protein
LIAREAAPASAAPITGIVDEITSSYEKGWSCQPGSDQPGAVVLYAGLHRIGIFPNAINRPETSRICGPGVIQNGFQIDLTPIVLQQFYGQTSLSLYALGNGAPATLLPASNQGSANPYPLPSGLISSFSPAGNLSGIISGAPHGNVHANIMITAGGPSGTGGIPLGNATLTPSPQSAQSFSFSSPELGNALASSPPAYNIPVYAYFSYNEGPAVQLGSPAMLGTSYQPINAQVIQSGSQSGIASSTFTQWIPTDMNFAGLSGSLSLQGSYQGFSEALITIGYTSDGETICRATNQTSSRHLSPVSRLAGFTLKSNDTNAATLPVSIALPYSIPLAGPAGTCLVTSISAGYLYLDAWSAKYTATRSNLAAVVSPAFPSTSTRFAEGIGGEFRFQSGTEPSLYTVVALKMLGTTQLDAIAGSISVAGIIGPPAKSAWQPPPLGNWTANTNFYAYSAKDCQMLGLHFGNPTPHYLVGSNRTPTDYVVPPSATLLLNMPLYGNGAAASQQTVFQTFPNAAQLGTSRVILSQGECLVALHNVSAPGNNLFGNIDFENQSTAYFHIDQN